MPLRPSFRLPAAAAAILLVSGACASSLRAQTPATDSTRLPADSLSLDSLRARLERAEAAIAVLRQQVAVESESAVHSRSRLHIELSAQVLSNSFLTRGRANSLDVPLLVLPPVSPGSAPATNGAVGFTVRQTRLGVAAAVDQVAGGTFSGDATMDFFGGDSYSAGDRPLFPLPRLRTARARLTWARTELMIGSDSPLISTLDPVSLAAIGTPDFSGAGNLWNWLGQVRLTRELASMGTGQGALHWAIQGAVMEPYAGQVAPGEPDAVDAGERSERPSLEARLRARWGDEDGGATIADGLMGSRGGEIGFGIHRGWVATTAGSLSESRALSVDAHAVIFRGVELRGEAYAGQLLRGLGGGGIAQNFGLPPAAGSGGALGPPVRDAAGWAQLNVQPMALLLAGVGCGVDLADHRDDPARLQNTACAVHAEWRPAQPIVIGAEYRQLGTRYSAGTYGARHLNLSFGFEL